MVREYLAEELAAVEQRQLEAHVDRRRGEVARAVAGAVDDAERGGGVRMQLDGVQSDTEFAVDAGRGHRRVVEGEQAEGRRQRLLPAMASKVDRGHADWTKLQLSKLCLEARGFRKNRNCDSVS